MGWMIRGSIPGGCKDDSLLQNVQTVCDDHSGSYTKGTLGSILEGKTASL